ncbi:hypothetical protein FGB62_139g127 [Gracilaria domingensis]|nr:hypothetical protein FGB62_139g127 [Gracilaria domingensis]
MRRWSATLLHRVGGQREGDVGSWGAMVSKGAKMVAEKLCKATVRCASTTAVASGHTKIIGRYLYARQGARRQRAVGTTSSGSVHGAGFTSSKSKQASDTGHLRAAHRQPRGASGAHSGKDRGTLKHKHNISRGESYVGMQRRPVGRATRTNSRRLSALRCGKQRRRRLYVAGAAQIRADGAHAMSTAATARCLTWPHLRRGETRAAARGCEARKTGAVRR